MQFPYIELFSLKEKKTEVVVFLGLGNRHQIMSTCGFI